MAGGADTGDVFIVEDDLDIRETLVELLEMEGYRPLTASDGAEALERLRRTVPPPRVILLDLMMPRMDGAQFLVEQRADPDIADIPVLVLTAARQSAPPGAAGILLKPLDVPQLLQTLERYCQRERSGGP